MSVINDMLRDLEQRKAAGRGGLSHAGALSVVQTASTSTLRAWLLALLVVLLALGLGVWYWQKAWVPGTVKDVAVLDQKSPVETNAVAPNEPVSQTEPAPTSVPVAAVESAATTPILANTESKPVASAALTEPDPVKSTDVVEETTEAQETTTVQETRKVQEKADVEEKTVAAEKTVVDVQLPAPKEPPVAQASDVPLQTAIVPQALPETPVVNETEPLALPAEELAPAKAVVASSPRPVVTLTPEAQDQKQAADARALLRRGEVDTALGQLQQFIDQAEVDLKSRAVLVNYLLQSGRLVEAGDALSVAPVDKDPDLRQLKARWLAVGGRPNEAVSLLESDKPALVAFPDYHALLASYYQQLGQAEPAATVYAELLKFNPAQANWWAGRALALDRLARYDEAKVAYERALVLPGLSGQLAQFAKQRLENL